MPKDPPASDTRDGRRQGAVRWPSAWVRDDRQRGAVRAWRRRQRPGEVPTRHTVKFQAVTSLSKLYGKKEPILRNPLKLWSLYGKCWKSFFALTSRKRRLF